jgi:DNA-binding transcriptional LysR family regulator
MKFTLHQLEVFGVVAKVGSMTKAAEKLFMTQPAVSIQMKQLQESIGMPLFEKVGRSLSLTEAGKSLYRLHNQFSQQRESFEAQLALLQGGLKGKLTISSASTAKYFLPYLLGTFLKRYPQVEISLKVTNRNEVLRHMRENLFDLAVLTQLPENDDYICTPFLSNPLVIGAPPDHPLVDVDQISFRDLANEPFLNREPGSGTRMVMLNLFKKYGIDPPIAMELGTNEAIKQAIMADIGISLMSELSLQEDRKAGRLRVLNVKELPHPTHWHLIHREDKMLSPVTKHFIDFITGEDLSPILPYQQ